MNEKHRWMDIRFITEGPRGAKFRLWTQQLLYAVRPFSGINTELKEALHHEAFHLNSKWSHCLCAPWSHNFIHPDTIRRVMYICCLLYLCVKDIYLIYINISDIFGIAFFFSILHFSNIPEASINRSNSEIVSLWEPQVDTYTRKNSRSHLNY